MTGGFLYKRPRRRAEISMAPLIDMVFLLLIFFAVTTTFTRESGLEVNKAKASTSQAIQKEQMLVALNKDGLIGYDKQIWTMDGIAAKVQERLKETPKLTIVIIPDKDGRVEPLVTIMDAFRRVGADRLCIGTKKVVQE